MSDDDYTLVEREIFDEMFSLLESRKSQYGPILLTAIYTKVDETWRNTLFKIEPQYSTFKKESNIIHEYEKIIIAKVWLEFEEFKSLIKEILSGDITIDGLPDIKFKGKYYTIGEGPLILSGDTIFRLKWPSNIYHFNAKEEYRGRFPRFPIVSLDNPLFPGRNELCKQWCNIDSSRHSSIWNSYVFSSD